MENCNLDKFIRILFLSSILFFSCLLTEINSEQAKVKNMYKHYLLSYNFTKEYLLVQSNIKSKIPNSELTKYFVFDLGKSSIILESSYRNGNVSWHSNYEIKIAELPGVIPKDEVADYSYILNVKTKFKTILDGENN